VNLYEYQAKRLFGESGVPVSSGDVAGTSAGAAEIAARLGGTVVVKAQVLTGGRGKAGGVAVVHTPEDARAAAQRILGMDIKGHEVRRVLVEPAADIREEIYLSVVLDRAARTAVVIASREGGMDIEEVAATKPEAIVRVAPDPILGLRDYQVRELAYGIGLDGSQMSAFGALVRALVHAYDQWDATLVEINPLAITGGGAFLGLDGKMSLDENALFRHPEALELRDVGEETQAERDAREAGLSYVDLEGSIGCLVNGAGLAMATMDVIKFFGGEPANFLDIGGGAQADKVEAAMRIILRDTNVRAVLINIFGGITRGDEVARGLLAALERVGTDVPMVARIVGTNAEEARQILADADLETARTLADAAAAAVRLAAVPAREVSR
jgi:succinyl-CoA synthetase beta subunit